MNKKILSIVLVSLAGIAAKVAVNSTCFFSAYQPKLPDSVKKMRVV